MRRAGVARQGVHIVSTDEKTGMQALERAAPTLPMKPGQVERQEANYVRHGTLMLTANLEVATGKVICPTIGPTRDEEDFAAHVEQTVASDPQASWIFVTDQLNTHQSETLVQAGGRVLRPGGGPGRQGQDRACWLRWPAGGRFWKTPAIASASCTRRGTPRG